MPADIISISFWMRPLHDTEIPALQAPATIHDDHYTPLSTTISVILPHELVERILLLLDIKSILTCRLINKEFNQIIGSSIALQYFLACKAAGVIDNPKSPLSYADRLEALQKREDAWKKLKPAFEMSISVNHRAAFKICRSTEGVFFLSDTNWEDLNYCHLASFPQDKPQWIKIPGHNPVLDKSGILINFVAALHEHDLIVNLMSSGIENQEGEYSLELVLLKFSTGEYHPLARHPRIHVQLSYDIEPWAVSRIVGDNLALVVQSDEPSDKLFIFNWKTGCKLLQHEATECGAYSSLVFVSSELLLLPNCVLSHIEVWHIPPSQLIPKHPIQILSLKIPALSPEYSLFDFICYGGPNPFLQVHSTPHFPPRPFFSSSEDSIVVVGFRMSSDSRGRASYNLVIHRRALLDTIQKWTSPLLREQERLPAWLTNEVTVHNIADTDDGSVTLDARSMLVSLHPQARDLSTFATAQNYPIFPMSHISPYGSSSVSSGLSTNSSTTQCNFMQVQWADWGPPISRWFHPNETQAWETAVSNGQRYAFSDPNPRDRSKLMISVADFNPHNFRKNAEIMARPQSGEGKNNSSNGDNKEEEEFEILDHKGVFSEEVYMGLKCVVYRAPDEYDLDAVMMDEHRLLGVKLNRDGSTESIKVLYIG